MDNSNQVGTVKSKFKFSSQGKACKDDKANEIKEKENFNIEELQKYYADFKVKFKIIEEELKDFDIKFDTKKINKDELKQNLEEINESIRDLKDDYKNNASFLVGYDKQNYMSLIEDLNKNLESKKEKLNPKKKFVFSNKSTVIKDSVIQSDIIQSISEISPTNFKNENNEFILCEKSDLEKLIISKDEIGEKNNLIIDNIKNCEIYILHSFKALYIKNVCNCKIFIGSVAGGSHITNCTDSKFYLATHQLRIHHTYNTNFFIISNSNPIIEESSELIFSPLNISYKNFFQNLDTAKIDVKKNKWNLVLDFKWHKKEKSPNFDLKDDLCVLELIF